MIIFVDKDDYTRVQRTVEGHEVGTKENIDPNKQNQTWNNEPNLKSFDFARRRK